MSDDIVQANFRMPKSLKDKVELAAKENKRSMTAELVARLEQSFEEGSYFELSDKKVVHLDENDFNKLANMMQSSVNKKPTS